MAVAIRSASRKIGEAVEFQEAPDGILGMKLAWLHQPDVVVADEISSRAGAFAVARDLKGSIPPSPARVVILLDRPEDRWLAAWSGADAWFVKPVDPFELAETMVAILGDAVKEAG